MDSIISTIQSNINNSSESRRKKRRKTDEDENEARRLNNRHGNGIVRRWRTEKEQQIYSSKLYEALCRSRLTTNPSSTTKSKSSGQRIIHETADRVLAVSAQGTTRWSRAILTNRVKARLKMHRRAKAGRSKKPEMKKKDERRKLPPLERKVKILSGLVPGCRKLSFLNILEEATDYIAALEMQVRAMATLTEILAGGSSSADRVDSNSVLNSSS